MKSAARLLRDSGSARWIVLLALSIPMFASYFFDDIFTTVSHVFQNPQILDLGWSLSDYGFYGGAYSLLCVWGGLVICGMLLDKWGVKITGTLFVGLMIAGALIVSYAISESFSQSGLNIFMGRFFTKPSLALAYAGCAVFGLGSEIAGVAVTRSIAKWFKGKEMALAMGLQLALARLGTATALIIVPRIVNIRQDYISFSETSKPALVGIILMGIALLLWALFLFMDIRLDRQNAEEARKNAVPVGKEDKFKFSDVFKILGNKHFILIALLCVFFYACIISFRRFATTIIIPRFGLESDVASLMVSMIPFSTMIFTPLFGSIVDSKGKSTRFMFLGSLLLLISHLIIAFAPGQPFFGYTGVAILGVGYALVPAAMWPSVPKIIPEKNLGTAYSLIYWIQNMGMLIVPVLVGLIITGTIEAVHDPSEAALKSAVNAQYFFILLSIIAIAVAWILMKSSDRNPGLMLDVPNKKR
ncbi:MAG: MFS transporter [Bacteroidales bacterium]|nr:MFS transporter [Bacteroidales bacterium]MDD3989024.1 MFS transporter [Bacteroidales bacterium]MDD4638636.1 MFS transporter [Bacteroidales bacterium]